MDLQELRKWAAEMERSATALMHESGGDAQMMQSAFGSSRVALLLSDSAKELESLRAQLAAVTAQRDELLHRARQTVWQGITCGKPYQLIPGEPLRAQLIVLGELCGAIEDARAQPEQPQQPPIQQPAVAEPTIQSGEFSFLDQLPKGPALGRFSASERAELDDLKRKAFKAGEP